jgi:predicted nucleic acid-binding protein
VSVTSRSAAPSRIIDASALVELLLLGDRAGAVERAIRDVHLAAPDSINPEVLSTVRGLERSGQLDGKRAAEMVDDLLTVPVTRVATLDLTPAVWKLRHNLTAYDACYVALARELGAELITSDRRLARAPNLGVPLIVV